MGMSCIKLSLVAACISLLLFTGVSPAFAENEPNFSYFEDPNAALPAKKRAQTEAELPCITCGREIPKSKNIEQLESVAKEGKKQASEQVKRKQKSSELMECITCGREAKRREPKPGTVTSENAWNDFPEIAAYSNSSAVSKAIKWAEKNSFKSSRGMCYRYVKEALCGAKRPACKNDSLVDGYLSGNPVFADRASSVPKSKRVGTNAVKTFEEQGFKNLMTDPKTKDLIKNPASAPKGAILIYTGGGNGGHIEIKTGSGTKGSYVSDFSAPDSILQSELSGNASRRYELVGVMVKPMEVP